MVQSAGLIARGLLCSSAVRELRKKGRLGGKAVPVHSELEAERLVAADLRALGLCDADGVLVPAPEGRSAQGRAGDPS